jgi:hypothetical protein
MDVLCIFVIDLVPSNAGKPLRFKYFRSELKFLVVLKGSASPGDLGSYEAKFLGYSILV